MSTITANQKRAISARIDAFPLSGMNLKLSKKACRYTLTLYLLHLFCGMNLTIVRKKCGFHYQRLGQNTFCSYNNYIDFHGGIPNDILHAKDVDQIQAICQKYVNDVASYKPSLLQKPKIHLLLHLAKHMEEFGPTGSFNTER